MTLSFTVPLLFLALLVWTCVRASDNTSDIIHYGSALPAELAQLNSIEIKKAPFPDSPREMTSSSDGHAFKQVDIYGNHHIATTIYVHSPGKQDSKIEMRYIYGDDTCRWISENILFLRVWWGRHWGSDYLYNADTCRFVYVDGFHEPMQHPK